MSRWLMSVALVMLLAACGTGTETLPTLAPTLDSGASGPAGEATPTRETLGGGAPPGAGATFSIQVTGAVTASLLPGSATAQLLASSQQYRLNLTASGNDYRVELTIPQGVTVGTFSLTDPSLAGPDSFGAALVPTGSSDPYQGRVRGSITIDAVGDNLSGSFEFSASNRQGQSVRVTGTFSRVPLPS